MVDNYEAGKLGVFGKKHGVEESGEAVLREGADELTLRAEEEGLLRTLLTPRMREDSRWRPNIGDLQSSFLGQC